MRIEHQSVSRPEWQARQELTDRHSRRCCSRPSARLSLNEDTAHLSQPAFDAMTRLVDRHDGN
jgi:hypothetical protein